MFTLQEHFYVFTRVLRDLEYHFLSCQRPILKAIIKYSSKHMSIRLGCCDESKQIYHNNCIKLCGKSAPSEGMSKIYGLQTVSRGHDYRSYKERTIIALHGEKCEVFGTIS